MEDGDNGNVQLLDEEIDEKYEPTDKEIREYADWLGIDLDEDADLLWIARRGLTTPLPKPWRPCQSAQGEIFYFNPETGENTWDHPCDEQLRELYAKEKANKQPNREDSDKQNGATSSGAPQEADNSISSDATPNASIIGPLGLGSDDGDVHESIDILSLGPLSPQADALPSPEGSPVITVPSSAEKSTSEKKEAEPHTELKQEAADRPCADDPPPPAKPPRPSESAATKVLPSDKSEVPRAPPPPPSSSAPPGAAGVLGSLGSLPPLTPTSSAAGVMGMLEPQSPDDSSATLQPPPNSRAEEAESKAVEAPAPPQAVKPLSPAGGLEDLFSMPLDLEVPGAHQASGSSRQQGQQQGHSSAATPVVAGGSSASTGRVREVVAQAEEAALLRKRLSESEAECSRLRVSAGEAARLRRQLETRAEQAAAAPAAAAPALSALSEELASEAAECRRWRAEGSSRGRDLERLRADSAAEMAAHAQVAADLRAELAAARSQIAKAEARRTEAEALTDATRARASSLEDAHDAQASALQSRGANSAAQQAYQNVAECSGEARSSTADFLAADAPSPPTPELAAILEAELRPDRGAPAGASLPSRGAASCRALQNATSPGADAVSPAPANVEQSSLWSHLLEDDAPPETPRAEKASSAPAVASSSLDISSLSAILVHSPPAIDSREDGTEACIASGGVDDRRRRRRGRPPGLGAAANDDVCCHAIEGMAVPSSSAGDELSALRSELKKQAALHDEKVATYAQELHQLRVELEQERAAAAALRCRAMGSPPAVASSQAPPREKECQMEAMTSQLLPGSSYVGYLDPTSSRAPTLKLEACWEQVERTADLGATALRGGCQPDRLCAPLQAFDGDRVEVHSSGTRPAAGVEDPSGRGVKCRAALAAVPGQKAAAPVAVTGDTEVELARLALEVKQWREDAGNSERLLHESRVALHKEQASHAATKASMRDSQREVSGLRSLLRSREAKEELAMAEVEQCRSEFADSEAERQRMQMQLHTRETELARLRAQQTVQSKQGDVALRQQRIALAEREEILGGRERFLDEREQLATEAEAMLRKQRSELRGEIQRAELAGLRATVSELAAPLLATPTTGNGSRGRCVGAVERSEANRGRVSPRSSSVPALTAALAGTSAVSNAVTGTRAARRAAQVEAAAGSAWASSDESVVPSQITRRLDGGRLDDVDAHGANSSATSPSGPAPAPEVTNTEQATSAGVFGFAQADLNCNGTPQAHPTVADTAAATLAEAAAAAKACPTDDLPERLRSWRHELRREHAALEEDRRLWRCEARQVRKVGTSAVASDSGSVGAGGVLAELGVLGEVRAALDARAAALNSSINEYRSMEKMHSHSTQSGRRRSSSNAGLSVASTTSGLRPQSAGSSRSGARRRSHSTSSMPAPVTTSGAQRAGSWLDAGISTVAPGKAGTHEEDLLRRWRHVLQPQACVSNTEFVTGTPRTASLSDPANDPPLCARLAGAGGA